MSFGIGIEAPTGGDREAPLPKTLDPSNLGPGFSVIDINTVSGNTRTPTAVASFITSASTTPETTLATLTRNPFGRINLSSLLDEISEPTPTNQPSLATPPPATFPSIIMATDYERTIVTATPTGKPSPDRFGNSEDMNSTQRTESTSRPLSAGAAVGISIAVLVVLALLGIGIFKFVQYRRSMGASTRAVPGMKNEKPKPGQVTVMPYLATDRSLEEGWETESSVPPYVYPFDGTGGHGLGVTGVGQQNNSSLTRLPIYR